ncbi:hypothetical protein F4802DRAFT_543138 [Xylaria palmicola]|nr:hypothetical protein F4802DRAFT_543138 [Xylaria palmicola]
MDSNQYPVYVGIWTNWSRGRVMGSTLTISRRDADLLIAFTAFFIAFVASRTWRILCFVLHRLYSTADPEDAIYHQRQTIFRNSSSPESGIQMLLSLLWANRRSKGWSRPLPAVTVAILCASLFIIAGGFSSRVSTAVGTEVLIKSSNCGYTPTNVADFLELSSRATKINSAANYAQQCYSDENTGLLDCGRLITKRVTSNIDLQAGCPFQSPICRNESTNLRIDSGYIDSHDILGLNAPPDERMWFRNVLHCAPLNTAGFTIERNASLGTMTLYQYGQTAMGSDEEMDYVYAARSVESQYSAVESPDTIVQYANYVVNMFSSPVKNGTTFNISSGFFPIGEIARADADIYLAFLSGNGVVFTEPSDDQWYHLSTTPSSFIVLGVEELQAYIPQDPASSLGCTEQYQFCNAASRGTGGCGPLASLRDAVSGAAPLFNTTYDNFVDNTYQSEEGARFLYLINMLFSSPTPSVTAIVAQLGPAGLTSQKTLYGGFQGPIASNQWQKDVSHWWDIVMAVCQSLMLDTVYIPDNSDMRATRFNYTSPEVQRLCNNQKMRSTAYASFSSFGLFFTLTAGLLLILVSYILEPISEWLDKRKGHNKYPYLEWATNSTLQLQRLLHEEIGFGTWSEGTETIPITKPGELLGSLDITNPRHPVLRRPMNKLDIPLFAEDTVIDDESDTDITPAPSNHSPDTEQEVNGRFQDLAGNETQVEGHDPTTNPTTVLPCDDVLLDEMAEPGPSEHFPIRHIVRGASTI